MSLDQESCTPCRSGGTALDATAIENLLTALPSWSWVQRDGMDQLERRHECADFATALHLANCVGALAEAEDHHPELVIEWGRLTVRYWTHTLKGLHRNDFVLAAKTERILQAS